MTFLHVRHLLSIRQVLEQADGTQKQLQRATIVHPTPGADAGKMQTCLRGSGVESIKFSGHAPLNASNVFEPHIFQLFSIAFLDFALKEQ